MMILVAGCGEDEAATRCTPGSREICQCPAGRSTMVCGSNGTYGECRCSGGGGGMQGMGGTSGMMNNCESPANRECNPGANEAGRCGFCGTRSRSCTDDCRWDDWIECAEEGECRAGSLESESCGGACGERARTCTAECAWNPWSDCAGASGQACTAGAEETEDCGSCGERTRSCADECVWNTWGECTEGGTCRPGEVEAEACGNCAARERLCSGACEWEEWGECNGEGQCSPGDTDVGTCGNCGTHSRDCTDDCIWGPYGPCSGEGGCAAGDEEQTVCGSDEGACQPGAQTRNCSDMCQWGDFGQCDGAVEPGEEICGNGIDEDCDGQDLIVQDENEVNDSCDTCTTLNGGEADPEDVVARGTIHSGQDRDYYCFVADDNFSPIFSERIRLSLMGVPEGLDYDLFLYRNAEDCNANNPLAVSDEGPGQPESIDWAEGRPADDSGTFVIEVRGFDGNYSCDQAYTLTVNGLN